MSAVTSGATINSQTATTTPTTSSSSIPAATATNKGAAGTTQSKLPQTSDNPDGEASLMGAVLAMLSVLGLRRKKRTNKRQGK